MPAVSLPDDFRAELNDGEFGQQINNTQGPGVAVYMSSDRRARADIYIGIKLDGVKRYENISSVDPTIKFQFVPKPVVFCRQGDIDFDPNKDKLITVKVNRFFSAK